MLRVVKRNKLELNILTFLLSSIPLLEWGLCWIYSVDIKLSPLRLNACLAQKINLYLFSFGGDKSPPLSYKLQLKKFVSLSVTYPPLSRTEFTTTEKNQILFLCNFNVAQPTHCTGTKNQLFCVQ